MRLPVVELPDGGIAVPSLAPFALIEAVTYPGGVRRLHYRGGARWGWLAIAKLRVLWWFALWRHADAIHAGHARRVELFACRTNPSP